MQGVVVETTDLREPEIVRVCAGDSLLAWILRATHRAESTHFVTSPEATFQAGFVVYSAGGAVRPHRHRPVIRTLSTTSEALFVRSGRMEADFYDEAGRLVETHVVVTGDVVVLLGGGHGFRMQEDTVLVEIKQGPYHGADEKEFL